MITAEMCLTFVLTSQLSEEESAGTSREGTPAPIEVEDSKTDRKLKKVDKMMKVSQQTVVCHTYSKTSFSRQFYARIITAKMLRKPILNF